MNWLLVIFNPTHALMMFPGRCPEHCQEYLLLTKTFLASKCTAPTWDLGFDGADQDANA